MMIKKRKIVTIKNTFRQQFNSINLKCYSHRCFRAGKMFLTKMDPVKRKSEERERKKEDDKEEEKEIWKP